MTQQEETTGQPGTKEQKDEMFRLGSVLWHTSDPEGGGPDVGISVGTGDCCIYAGEVPGLKGGWSLVIYTPSGRENIAETVNREQARDFIERLGRLLNYPPSPAKQIEEACRALRMENTEDRRDDIDRVSDNPLRRHLEEIRAEEGCPDCVPLWSWRRMKREVREAVLREALDAITPIAERDDMGGARLAWNAVSDLIPPLPPVFATEGSEARWIADTEAGVYDEEPVTDDASRTQAALALVLRNAAITQGSRRFLRNALNPGVNPAVINPSPGRMIEALQEVIRHVPLTPSVRSELLVEVALLRKKQHEEGQ